TDYEMSAIRPRTLGKFEALLLATAKSPAMLFYLDNFQSSSPNARPPQRPGFAQRRPGGIFGPSRGGIFGWPVGVPPRPNPQAQRPPAAQQAARRKAGINENYARELMELHTMGVEGGYTQKDVQEVARCFTGWTIEQPRKSGKFIFRPNMHDDGEKVVLGHKIPAGGGQKDGETVIDI